VDTVYAATIGDAAVAAIGLAVPFEFLMIALWVGLSTGLTSSLSRAMGSGEGEKIRQYQRACWVLTLVLAPLFIALGAVLWFAAPRLGLDEEVYRSFRIYGATLIGGSALTTFWSVIPDSVVKAHQDTRTTMWAGIWSNVLNLSLNTFFLFVLEWGIFGIALSTVLGRIGGLVYALVKAHGHETRRRAAGTHEKPGRDPHPYRAIFALAVPSSLTFILMAAETAVINTLLATGEHKTESLAAYSIFDRVFRLALQPVIAIAVAMLPFAALRFGNRDLKGIRRGIREGSVASVVYSIALVAPAVLLAAPLLAGWLAESPLTAEYAGTALRFVPLFCLTLIPFLLCRPVFEAMGRGGPGLAMAVLRYGVLTLPLAWVGMVAARSLGHAELYGLLIGILAASAVSSALFAGWTRSALRKAEGGLARD
jgi:Na+-driven multidrug efflux pump